MTDTATRLADPGRPVRMGMLGCGAIAVSHARRLREVDGVKFTALCDPSAAAMDRVAAETGQPSADRIPRFTDPDAMLSEAIMDAVCISSPNPWHVRQSIAALELGLHVLCEKPLSLYPDEADRLCSVARQSGRVVSIAYQSRYRPGARALYKLLRSGECGRINSVSIFSCEDWVTPNRRTWRHDPDLCPGGFFGDANGHQLDLVFWLTGASAEGVRAAMETRGTPVPMATWGEARLRPWKGTNLVMEGGAPLAFLFAGDARHWSEEIRIQTDRADFGFRNTRLLWTEGPGPLQPFPVETRFPDEVSAPDNPDAAFVAAIRGGPPVLSPPESVWPVLLFTRAAMESAGRPMGQAAD